MNRQFYVLAILFLTLSMVGGLVQSIVFLLVAGQMFYMTSFLPWFCTVNLVIVVAGVFLLKYYYLSNFRLTFWAGLVSLLVNVMQSVLMLVVIIGRQMEAAYIFVVTLNVVAGLVYACTLAFSKAGRRRWLKTAGIYSVVIGLVMAVTLILMFAPSVDRGLVEKGSQWVLVLGSVVPAFLIVNLLTEMRSLEGIERVSAAFGNSGALLAMAALVSTLTFGILMVRETQTTIYWRSHNERKAMEFVERSQPGRFGTDGESLEYVLMKPLDPDVQQKYPLVVCLPYAGYEAPAAQLLAEEAYRRKYPSFLFVPRCPEGAGWGGTPNYPAIDSLVFQAIADLENKHPIDMNRIYVTGISRGGYGSWHFISTRPDLFAAAIPVCGKGEPGAAPKITNVAVWAFHGAKDMNVPIAGSRDMIQAIKNAGGNPIYTEYPEEAHNIWHRVSTTTGLWDWLFNQDRRHAKGIPNENQ